MSIKENAAGDDGRGATPPPARPDRTHWLYIAVLVAVVAGAVLGGLFPNAGKAMAPLGTGFVNLIKMMISPVIFCTIVLGIGSVRKAASVGRVGGLALGYFLVMSTFALAIGLVVGNFLQPGDGLQITQATSSAAQKLVGKPEGTTDFLLGIIPTSLLTSLTSGAVLQTLFVALLVGFALQSLGKAGEPVLRGIGHVQKLVFKVLAMILWLSPIGAFGAIANVVGQTGWSALVQLGVLMVGFYATCIIFVVGVLGTMLRAVSGVDIQTAAVPGQRVPAHRGHLVLGVGPAAADRQDGALRGATAHGGCGGAHGLLVQPRRHRHLPHHGLDLHR